MIVYEPSGSLLPNFQKGRGGAGSQFFRWGLLGNRAETFFRGGCSFYVKIKLKCEIFNNNKSLTKFKQKFKLC